MYLHLINFLYSSLGNNLLTLWVFILLILFVFLTYFNRRYFIKLIQNTNKLVLIILGIIIILFTIVNLHTFKTFVPSDEEWQLLTLGKELINNSSNKVFFKNRYGIVYPLLVAIIFKIFSLNPIFILWLNVFLGIATVLIVFFITKELFKKDIIALTSVLFLLLSPIFSFFTFLGSGLPTTTGFFLSFLIFISILAFKYHTFSLNILSFVTLSLLTQVKPEYFALTIIFLILFLISQLHWSRKIIILSLALLIMFPSIINLIRLQSSYEAIGYWCGTFSQTSMPANAIEIFTNIKNNHRAIKIIDQILNKIINPRFSILYFIYDLPNFIKYWFSFPNLIITILILIGIIISLSTSYFRNIPILCLIISFVLLNSIYLLDCAFYNEGNFRYIYPIFILIMPFVGLGLYFTLKFLIYHKLKIIAYIALFAVTSLLGFQAMNNFLELKDRYSKHPHYRNYLSLVQATKCIDKEAGLVIPIHLNEKEILKFLGYNKIEALNDSFGLDFFVNKEMFFKNFRLPLENNKNNYFIKSWYCKVENSRELCNFIEQHYNLQYLCKGYDGLEVYLISPK